jgi:hypothetical protein
MTMFALSCLPLIGAILGTAGAIGAWRWEWRQAALSLFGGFALSVSL